MWSWVPIWFLFICLAQIERKQLQERKRWVQPPQGCNPNPQIQFDIFHIQCHGVFYGVQWIHSSNASQQLDWWLHWHCLLHYSSSDHNKFGIRVIKCTNAFDVWAWRKDSWTRFSKMWSFCIDRELFEVLRCLLTMNLNVEIISESVCTCGCGREQNAFKWCGEDYSK